MQKNKPHIYITTPLYYVNSHPHIGHTYTTVVTDIIKRFYALQGKCVYLLTGTDEHGEKIEQAACSCGLEVKCFVDDNSFRFKSIWDSMHLCYDDFIRTTEDRHKKVVNIILQKLYDSGDIYFDSYEGLYCLGCERFVTEAELIDGKCKDHDVEPKKVKEQNYFFKMSKYKETLKQHIQNNPKMFRPEWYAKEVLGYLNEDIGDLCISRPKQRLKWGIELPFDNNYVTYVWFDALINYISAIAYPDCEDFKNYWDVSEHYIAKDILRTHTIYWGTMLLAIGLPLYKHLNVHGYWNMSGVKMSKSLGNVIEPVNFKDKYGDQGLRFFFLKEMHWGDDSDFTIERFVNCYNSFLSNNYGNLVSRVMGMLEKYYQGQEYLELDNALSSDHGFKNMIEDLKISYLENFKINEFHKPLEQMWKLFDEANKYIAESKPWDLFKAGDIQKLSSVLSIPVELIRICTYMLIPVMPEICNNILTEFGINDADKINFDNFTQWGYTKKIKLSFSQKMFFQRLEP